MRSDIAYAHHAANVLRRQLCIKQKFSEFVSEHVYCPMICLVHAVQQEDRSTVHTEGLVIVALLRAGSLFCH